MSASMEMECSVVSLLGEKGMVWGRVCATLREWVTHRAGNSSCVALGKIDSCIFILIFLTR